MKRPILELTGKPFRATLDLSPSCERSPMALCPGIHAIDGTCGKMSEMTVSGCPA